MIFTGAFCFVLVATYSATQGLALPRVVQGIENSQTFVTDTSGVEGDRKESVPEMRRNSEVLYHRVYGNSYSNRRKRAVQAAIRAIQIGMKVVEEFLANAKQVPSTNELRRKYIKPGGAEQWSRDFDSFIYDEVTDYKTKDGVYGQVGKIGNRVVITKNRGPDGYPTTEILRAKDKLEFRKTGRKFDRVRDEITYTDVP